MLGMLSLWNFETSSKDATLTSVVRTFLGPVELTAFYVERHPHAPLGCIRPRPSIALARVNERSSFEPSRLTRMTLIPSRSDQ